MSPGTALHQGTALAAVLTGGAALMAGAVALAATRRPATALAVLLDLLLAAGLLRLAGEPGWPGIATAAAIIILRRLIGVGLRAGGDVWSRGAGGGGVGRTAVRARSPAVERLVRPAWRR